MPKEGRAGARRVARHRRVRRRVRGAAHRPRLAVFRSLKHIYAQIIDDDIGATVAAASSAEADVRVQRDGKAKGEVSKLVGKLVADRAAAKGIKTVVFDRAGYKYHGRVKAVADAAREGGLVF